MYCTSVLLCMSVALSSRNSSESNRKCQLDRLQQWNCSVQVCFDLTEWTHSAPQESGSLTSHLCYDEHCLLKGRRGLWGGVWQRSEAKHSCSSPKSHCIPNLSLKVWEQQRMATEGMTDLQWGLSRWLMGLCGAREELKAWRQEDSQRRTGWKKGELWCFFV